MKIESLITTAAIVVITGCTTNAHGVTKEAARSPDKLDDLELAHVTYTADNIDI